MAPHPSQTQRQHSPDAHKFLTNLNLSTSLSKLKDLNRRRLPCPKCNRNRHAYCYDCMIPIEQTPDILPQIHHLPLHCIVVQHPGELKSKSSAVHAKVLAPDSVSIVEYGSEEMEKLFDKVGCENGILLYPDRDAWSLRNLLEKVMKRSGRDDDEKCTDDDGSMQCTGDEHNHIREDGNQGKHSADDNNNTILKHASLKLKSLKYVVFIDSTWQQSGRIFRDPRINQLTHVKIKTQKTAFWRYQNKGNEFLATIEAIYWFYHEYHVAKGEAYDYRYDDLLFLFAYQYFLIQSHYKKQDRSFPRIAGYTNNTSSENGEQQDENSSMSRS